MILSRPVNPRARRIALIVASVPELTIRTISTAGTNFFTSFASSISFSELAPKLVLFSAADFDRLYYTLMRMTEDHRAPRTDIVDILVTVDIVDL